MKIGANNQNAFKVVKQLAEINSPKVINAVLPLLESDNNDMRYLANG